ncbi:YigZ family protein [Nitrosophilus alvini]|uniref:YigZ family protein n=1 Tax=Nitrosophilus alvini TaxID=2714855 RepID=UPI00190A296C|nr:YigZ family protein [Nitrosophilus alvini]
MKTVRSLSVSVLEVKRSRFHSFLVPFNEFEETLQDLRKCHPKANHFVTAFRYFNECNQIVEGSSDDKEPRGTSGRPTLKVLQGNGLVNVGIITVRYFGGVLLGAGGLVKAYSDSANLVISKADLIEYKEVEEFKFFVEYSKTREVEYTIEKNYIFVYDRKFYAEGIEYIIREDKEKIDIIRKII